VEILLFVLLFGYLVAATVGCAYFVGQVRGKIDVGDAILCVLLGWCAVFFWWSAYLNNHKDDNDSTPLLSVVVWEKK